MAGDGGAGRGDSIKDCCVIFPHPLEVVFYVTGKGADHDNLHHFSFPKAVQPTLFIHAKLLMERDGYFTGNFIPDP